MPWIGRAVGHVHSPRDETRGIYSTQVEHSLTKKWGKIQTVLAGRYATVLPGHTD